MPTENEHENSVEYTAQATAGEITGEVRLSVQADALVITALFDTAEIPYARITALTPQDYGVTVATDQGVYRFVRMGLEGAPFYDTLVAAYNRKVRKALFVSTAPLLTAHGDYRYEEYGVRAHGNAPFEVHDDCVLILPPNDDARRVPLCFVTAMENADYTLTLRLGPDESYTFARLGYDTEPFAAVLEKQLRALRAKALQAVKQIDCSLAPAQASAIAKLMPDGVAAPMGQLTALAPSFGAALEAEIAASRSAQEYTVLKTICDPAQIYVGIKKRFAEGADESAGPAAADERRTVPEETVPEETAPPGAQEKMPAENMLWLIVPGANGSTAAVEFAVAEGEAAATFIYRFDQDFAAFARAFNRALEAIAFKREVIRLSAAELLKPGHADAAMAVRRNAALRFVRNSFAGRVIHASPAGWKRNLLSALCPAENNQ